MELFKLANVVFILFVLLEVSGLLCSPVEVLVVGLVGCLVVHFYFFIAINCGYQKGESPCLRPATLW